VPKAQSQRRFRHVQEADMDLVLEHAGRHFDLKSEEGRQEFDEYVNSLPTKEEQYEVNAMALAATDKLLRSLGFYCGLPLRELGEASQELYGYLVPRPFDTEPVAVVEEAKPRLINRWNFKNKQGERGTVSIYEGVDGKRFHRVAYRQLDWQFRFERTITSLLERDKSNPFQAELKAQEKLRTIISERQYACYIVSGAFVEYGKSGVAYLIRRGLPTIAFRFREKARADVLTVLCMKPMGGHRMSFAGVMVPTDEVITTALLIKADEPELWKRANHLDIDDPISGL